jgi:muramidase (phage lysozyme)
MTLRLSLLIDGTSKEAVIAVDKTVAALDALNAKAKTTGAGVGTAVKTAGEGAAQAAALSSQQLANMQFQLQDIGVSLAGGQSPFTVMAQQGSQIVGIFKQGTSVATAFKAVVGGLAAAVTNPLNLSVIAIGIAATGIQALFSGIKSGVNDTEKDLESHADLIKKIGDNYDTATGRAKNYAAYTVEMLAYLAKRDTDALRVDLEASIQGAIATGSFGIGPSADRGSSMFGLKDAGPELQGIVQGFLNSVRAGKPDVQSFGQEVLKVAQNAEKNSALRVMADQIYASIEPALQLRGKLEQAEDAAKGLTGDTHLLNNALGQGSEKVQKFASAIKAIDIPEFNRDRQGVDRNRPDLFAGKSILDIIGQSEGTDRGRGYNETLGYGKFTGPLELVAMNLKEILAVQAKMLDDPSNSFNSSALGRYQITSETIKDFAPKLGLTDSTIFSPAVQDKLANAILLSTKGSYDAFVGRWASGKDVSPATFRRAYNEAAGQTSSVAQDMTDVATKKQEAASKEKERAIDIQNKWQAVLRGEQSQLSGQLAVLGKSAAAIAANRKEQELLNRAHALFGENLAPEVIAQIRAEADAYGVAAAKVDDLKKAQAQQGVVASLVLKKQQQDLGDYISQLDDGRSLVRGFVSTFVDAEVAGKSFFDSLKSAADNLLDSFLKLSETKFLDALLGKQGGSDTGFLGNLFGSLFGGGGDTLYANGAAFAGGAQVQAFAKGDVFGSPTFFPMRGGKTGLLGEAGYPEAIMPLSGSMRVGVATPKGETSLPLTRLASGKLGVKADHAFAEGGVFGSGTSSSGSAGGGDLKVNLVVHNSTGEKATAKAKKNPDGSLDLKVMVGNIMAERIAGGHVDAALNNRFDGLSRKTERYG